MTLKTLQALFLCSLCFISTKFILSIGKNYTITESRAIDTEEKPVTYQDKVVNFLKGYVERPAEKNNEF